ncbi:hypothetical protein DFS34DRAFT_628057 [Phlyctochytrium arcticum]|nr:hypothetical protein DFS34DRAFT_628057 [Phlyctochytrium arcticum]
MTSNALQQLVPRSYQLDLLNKAQDGNIIAVLDTGSGKTLISVLLIKHYAEVEEMRKNVDPLWNKRISIMLVPTVALVSQQEAYVRNNVDLRVNHYYGRMSVNMWTLQKWRQEIEGSDVMVMTADIFMNLLAGAYMHLREVALIVLDECHHARKHHPYSQIMGIYYKNCPTDERPRVLGMTASPVFAKEDTIKSIQQLEANLFAKAFTVAPEAVRPYVPRPEETIVSYDVESLPLPKGLSEILEARKHILPERVYNLFQTALSWNDELGPWCSLMSVKYDLQAFKRRSANSRHPVDPSEILSLEKDLRKIPHPPPHRRTSQLSNKIETLLEILVNHQANAGFCAIVFVERRSHAYLLHEVLRDGDLQNIRSEVFVGQGSMTVPKQQAVLRDFRDLKINLLIATRVAEEGLDVKSCMLVIRFDFGQTLVNYIQSRGRARHIASKMIILSERTQAAEAKKLANMQQSEREMQMQLQTRSDLATEALLHGVVLDSSHIYTVPTTGATITPFWAIGRLYHYCSLLPSDTCSSTLPRFQCSRAALWDDDDVMDMVGLSFKVCITLPNAVPAAVRYAAGPPASTKRGAKQLAAFEAVKTLHRLGELTDHLTPKKYDAKFLEEHIANAFGPLPTRERRQVLQFRLKTPNLWKGTWTTDSPIWMSQLEIAGSDFDFAHVAILTVGDRPMPAMRLIISTEEKKQFTVKLVPMSTSFHLTEAQLTAVRSFHHLLFKSILRSDVKSDVEWAAITVPLRSNSQQTSLPPVDRIDWGAVNQTLEEPRQLLREDGGLETSSFEDTVLENPAHWNRLYIPLNVLWSATPDTEIGNLKNFFNLADFYKYRLKFEGNIRKEQPLIEARHIVGQNLGESVHLLPQACSIHQIPARILRGAFVLPPAMEHIQHRLLAGDLANIGHQAGDDNQQLSPMSADLDDIRIALTTPAVDPVCNYERFETLGDSFLKVHQTFHLFAHFPTWHEGNLSKMRNRVEANKALRAAAAKIDLEGYALGKRFHRKTWVPPIQNDEGGSLHQLSDKTVADIVEALIGACAASGGTTGGAACIVRLLGQNNEADWGVYHKLSVAHREAISRSKPDLSEATMEAVEAELGYKYRDRTLIQEALTHPTAINLGPITNSYQRLEFLGDAVLGYLITRHLFQISPELSPHQLTVSRSALVNNQFLGCVSWHLGLPRKLIHMSSFLASEFTSFSDQLQEKKVELNQGSSDSDVSTELFWTQVDPPKAAGDVVESLIGAAFLDCSCDLDKVWLIIKKIIIDPWWNSFERAGYGNANCTVAEEQSKLSAVQFIAQWNQRTKCRELVEHFPTDVEEASFTCKYTYHGTVIGEAKGPNKRTARRAAAELAVSVLKNTEHCPCNPADIIAPSVENQAENSENED